MGTASRDGIGGVAGRSSPLARTISRHEGGVGVEGILKIRRKSIKK